MTPGSSAFRGWLFAAVAAFALAARVGAETGAIRIERAFMADAAPSSFAVSFSNGLSVCFDPVRGGVNYVWLGGFDVAPARPGLGKFIKPVKLLGDVLYRETGAAPLRRGDATRPPVVVFHGYRLRDGAVEFVYTVDGVRVREELRLRPGGDGLLRKFRPDAADADTRWWYVPGATGGAVLTSPTGAFEGSGFRFDAQGAREFTLEIVLPRK